MTFQRVRPPRILRVVRHGTRDFGPSRVTLPATNAKHGVSFDEAATAAIRTPWTDRTFGTPRAKSGSFASGDRYSGTL